ncbi:SAM-dependent methyltransferase [Wenyingzhuangia sp. IMCC45574]
MKESLYRIENDESVIDFPSGEGFHHPKLIEPYLKVMTEFLTSFNHPITVCELGFGDLTICEQLIQYTDTYIVADIISGLIQPNTVVKSTAGVLGLDISNPLLPRADCVILRKTLLHLNNAQIKTIVARLPQYKYAIVTEHLPTGVYQPNKDIVEGKGVRIQKNSGVDLTAPPFNLQVKSKQQLFSVALANKNEEVVTMLYKL